MFTTYWPVCLSSVQTHFFARTFWVFVWDLSFQTFQTLDSCIISTDWTSRDKSVTDFVVFVCVWCSVTQRWRVVETDWQEPELFELSHSDVLTELDFVHSNHRLWSINRVNLSLSLHFSNQVNYMKDLTKFCFIICVCCFVWTGFVSLTGLTNLRVLNLAFCRQVTDQTLSFFSSLTNLELLFLDHCRSITLTGLKKLSHLCYLRLSIPGCQQIPLSSYHLLRLRSLSEECI